MDKILLLLFFILVQQTLFAQQTAYYTENSLTYKNYDYKQNIHSVTFHKLGLPLSPPVVMLNSQEKLILRFDDFKMEAPRYEYKVIHCDKNWQPTNLSPQEYLTGYFDDQITTFNQSLNTLQNYYNYELVLPNQNISWTKSGNYLLIVYMNGNQDDLVLTRRFSVVNPLVSPKIKVSRPILSETKETKQEVNFTFTLNQVNISDPNRELTAVIKQNFRDDNALYISKPMFNKGYELDYNFDGRNLFQGGNEFRYFDIKNYKYKSERIALIKTENLEHYVYLYNDLVRNYDPYSRYPDINGCFQIHADFTQNVQTESEYMWVYFNLPYSEPLTDGNLYIFGQLSNWDIDKKYLMKYNYETHSYQTTLYLKQGYYNYEYVFMKDNSKIPDCELIEGSSYKTDNQYSVFIYYHPLGSEYDQLIGIETVNTDNLY